MVATMLIHHAGNRGRIHPPSSLRSLHNCQAASARLVEVDITPLSGGGFALLHGPLLERNTSGTGPVGAHTVTEIKHLRHVWNGNLTDEPIGLLSDALDLIDGHAFPAELQLDLKLHVPLTDAILAPLVEMLQPVKARVRVTSMADWALRRLRALDAGLALGFDPLLYLDLYTGESRDPAVPPFWLGAYGYWDAHPLASRRWGKPADYLAARSEALWVQAPMAAVWYIHAGLLARTLDDGFNWIDDLHSRGVQVAAWTLDTDRPGHVALAQRLAGLAVDRITTNTAPALASALDVSVTY